MFQWFSSLENRKHVGTESRFRLLFDALRDMVEHTEDNVQTRLDMLRDKKAEIEKEIRALELGQRPDSYSNEQVRERVDLFTRLCYELIGDFAEEVVRERFLLLASTLTYEHFDSFVRGKALWHTELTEVKGSTLRKLRSNVFRMLNEAGLLSDGGHMVQAVLSQRVASALSTRTPSELRFFPTSDRDSGRAEW